MDQPISKLPSPTIQPSRPLRIGVVIPAFNEARNIGPCLASLATFQACSDQIIVVDAASTDETASIAQRAGARVIRRSERQRGYAVAAGYEAVCDAVDVVLIAHADMRFHRDARAAIVATLSANPYAVGGVLGHVIDDPRFRFRIVEYGNRFRASRWQLPYGDQAMFVRTDVVAHIGGFPNQPSMEDLELALRCRRYGRWLFVDCPVTTDHRHWRRGVVRTTLGNWGRAIGYRLRRKEPALGIQPS